MPATKRKAKSGSSDRAKPERTLPTAAIAAPAARIHFLPIRSDRTADGMLVRNLANPNAVITSPTCATVTPNVSA